MKYWLTSLLCTLMLTGCGGNSSSSTTESTSANDIENTSTSSPTEVDQSNDESTSDETSVNDSATDSTTTTDTATASVDYSLMTCENDLSDVLALINQLRIESQTCGDTSYPAVAEVTWSSTLTLAATEHSNNMANYNFFDHTGLDGSTVGTRVTAQGYTWSRVSENIAGGQTSAQEVVDGWMSSEGHCTNIMNADVTEMGLACQVNSDSDYQRYWTQVFAKPR
ncbi:CAP domain-containing protein [Psychromonas sp. SP041]|uniref:CAP domain-containing protein n=1 Tax=Psychromonas sp. SP041 TaxID=1365007 RepID=UPI000410F1CC|nr:CAP domain-containing protein [Psychromonas sp. SP041]